mmetsp:Transcript_16405/g.24624  ORF Transcript_16405/g.24624 Transcript_16405/m.24624 type:complete len:240 (-) Transcript_16405:300-1019(-)|eukprot:CAMPEP_0194072750 /NCGR_PEP_ID=MMETSP0149-20130528/399_1 /TAXON_ID=122233 /ORGANISM="Chaetoceros debilis, Strain MM31A-1" /LENGTH=239 /DNA_ID=CAMNT_0038752655 /DNA_START=156 /DNA_END=875 /DNA_ORIENTATION=+
MSMMSGVLWSAICRDGIVLAEAGEDKYDGAVIRLAQKLLTKKATAGWEFEKARKTKLHGIKFHVFDDANVNANGNINVNGSGSEMKVWSFAAVAEKSLDSAELRSFVEKIFYITEPLRESEEWRNGDMLCAQASFAPILLQKMEQVQAQGKLAMVNQKLNTTKEIMADNIEMALAREESLQVLHAKSEETNVMARQFKKRAKQVKRFKMMQNAKNGLVLGTAVTAVTAIIIVPPLVALL